MTVVSFLHSGLPLTCISPIISTSEFAVDYPGHHGTGFFAKFIEKIYFITARHCLATPKQDDLSLIAGRLAIPYSLNGYKSTRSDYVEFSDISSLRCKYDENIEGEYIDIVVLETKKPVKEKNRKALLSRAVKIPPTGNWLEEFINSPLAKPAIREKSGINLVGIGYPWNGTNTQIIYGEPTDITLQPAKFLGHLGIGVHEQLLSLNNVTWEHDLNGFSGSPIFVGFKNKNGKQFALAGMAVMGGNSKVHLIKVNLISDFIRKI
jgi:hypothetical protein